MRRPVIRILALAGAAYGALLLLVTLLQDRLLYHPVAVPAQAVAGGRLAAWPTVERFRGLVAEPAANSASSADNAPDAGNAPDADNTPDADNAPRPTIVVFHGNAGHAGDRAWYADALVPLGYRVLLAEYPGYGPRAGRLGEESLVADAVATIAAAKQAFGEPIILLGESLGAGVAAAAARKARDDIAGLLLITPWDRLVHVAAHHYPWLPVRWLLEDRYETVSNLEAARLPTVVVVATEDRIVPARFGHALHQALPQPKTLLVIEGAGHNDWPSRIDAAWWRQAIAALLDAPPPGEASRGAASVPLR